MTALSKAHQQMRDDGAPPELLRQPTQALAPANDHRPVEPLSETAAIVRMIAEASRDSRVDIDKMERLILMRERMETKAAETAFNEAMARAQTEMRTVALDSSNPQTRSRYASYAALDKAIRPIYTRHGFALSFNTGDGAPENHVRVLCNVSCGGHSRPYHVDMPADGKGAKGGDVMTKTHATGSALSYGQRYLLKMIFNVSTGETDDDGNAAGTTPITDEQADEIAALIQETNSDIGRFLKWVGAPSISDIPARKYDAAVAVLNAKKKRVAP